MTFSQPLVFDVPVMPRVRKFLAYHYPAGITLNPSDPRLVQFWALVQTEKVKMKISAADRHPKALTSTIQVRVPQTTYTRQQSLLNYLEIRMVNKMLDLFIFQEFYALVRSNRKPGMGWLVESLREFTDRYDFSEEDLAEATLKMAYHRHTSTGNVGFDDASLRHSLNVQSSYLLPNVMAA